MKGKGRAPAQTDRAVLKEESHSAEPGGRAELFKFLMNHMRIKVCGCGETQLLLCHTYYKNTKSEGKSQVFGWSCHVNYRVMQASVILEEEDIKCV